MLSEQHFQSEDEDTAAVMQALRDTYEHIEIRRMLDHPRLPADIRQELEAQLAAGRLKSVEDVRAYGTALWNGHKDGRGA